MPIPIESHWLKPVEQWPSHIVIHHTAENKTLREDLKQDKDKFMTPDFMKYSYSVMGKVETGYHFIIERHRGDFYVVVSQPLLTKINKPDLDEQFDDAIHVALMGDYDKMTPKPRMFRILAYRILAPITRLFRMPDDGIVLHRDISNDSDVTCPGQNIKRSKVMSNFMRYKVKKTLRRV